jgi:hypothetical protein
LIISPKYIDPYGEVDSEKYLEEPNSKSESSKDEEVDEHSEAHQSYDIEDYTGEDNGFYRDVVKDGWGCEGTD